MPLVLATAAVQRRLQAPAWEQELEPVAAVRTRQRVLVQAAAAAQRSRVPVAAALMQPRGLAQAAVTPSRLAPPVLVRRGSAR